MRYALIWGVFFLGVFGLIRLFSPNNIENNKPIIPYSQFLKDIQSAKT